ncbi:MAG: hypothetical protein AAFY56_04575 [Pseudomonadota bacterium]
MEEERYPGEQQGLTLFLEEIRPIVESQLGRASLLHAAIRKALASGTLHNLRHARHIFNGLPRSAKQELSSSLVARASIIPDHERLLTHYDTTTPTPFVCFERDENEAGVTEVSYRHELTEPLDVRVMVKSDTLPSSAASSLRLIADTIERDRRMLSSRYWSKQDDETRRDETRKQHGQTDCG